VWAPLPGFGFRSCASPEIGCRTNFTTGLLSSHKYKAGYSRERYMAVIDAGSKLSANSFNQFLYETSFNKIASDSRSPLLRAQVSGLANYRKPNFGLFASGTYSVDQDDDNVIIVKRV
jgi:hypothetical protein